MRVRYAAGVTRKRSGEDDQWHGQQRNWDLAKLCERRRMMTSEHARVSRGQDSWGDFGSADGSDCRVASQLALRQIGSKEVRWRQEQRCWKRRRMRSGRGGRVSCERDGRKDEPRAFSVDASRKVESNQVGSDVVLCNAEQRAGPNQTKVDNSPPFPSIGHHQSGQRLVWTTGWLAAASGGHWSLVDFAVVACGLIMARFP